MRLPKEYFEFYPLFDVPRDRQKFHTFRGFGRWIEENKPEEIEMSEDQFWKFTTLQPLHAGLEVYWTTFRGIPLRCPEMTEDQQKRLGLWKSAQQTENAGYTKHIV